MKVQASTRSNSSARLSWTSPAWHSSRTKAAAEDGLRASVTKANSSSPEGCGKSAFSIRDVAFSTSDTKSNSDSESTSESVEFISKLRSQEKIAGSVDRGLEDGTPISVVLI